MQLRHDHALGTIDDKRAGGRHERNFAHVNFLFLDFFDGRFGRIFVHDDELDLGAQRRCEGEAALLTFFNVKRRHAEHVAHIFETRILGMTLYREYRFKRRLQPFGLACFRRGEFLQKSCERRNLGRQQIRYGQHVIALGETLADTFFLGKGVGHDQ